MPLHHEAQIGDIHLFFQTEGTVQPGGFDILLCHGWPELSHSWRGQMQALAQAGHRAIAPDMRGFGRSEAPAAIEDYTIMHLVGDMVGLLDSLSIEKAVIVGHDWGSVVAWHAALMRPDRFHGVVGLSVPWAPRSPRGSLIRQLRAQGLDRFYMAYFQEPGVAEADLQRDPYETQRRLLVGASGAGIRAGQAWSPVIPDGLGMVDACPPVITLPDWLREDDLRLYAENYARSGYHGGLNWYRNLDRNWALTAPWQGASIAIPACFIAGTLDGVLRMPGMEKAMAALPHTCSAFKGTTLIDGAGHWVQQEAPEAVNAALLDFLAKLA
jgi:pimeloyl-ACP methyl ester carboxylesterase